MSPEAARQLMEAPASHRQSVSAASPAQTHSGHLPLVVAILTLLIWSTLAVSVVSLSTVPPLLTTGIALTGGGLIGLPWVRWRTLDWHAVLIGSLSMFGYHALYFLSLQWADPVAASLLHYLWPLFIILLTPLMLGEHRISLLHVVSALCGFAGAAACIASGPASSGSTWAGFTLAGVSGLIWAYYTVWSRKRRSVPTSTVALYCVLAGGLALALQAALPSGSGGAGLPSTPGLADLSLRQWATLAFLALGPLGGTFYMWDFAIKRGRPNQIAILAYAVPVASTLFVGLLLGRGADPAALIGAVMVSIAVALGNRADRQVQTTAHPLQ
ncbi:hypothetical protein PIN31115_02867 [Pandoraea iniqua]|uniref:EamA domain-containing protein n=1 Tax=Pandoraea iniqua TaxID=2508288 RepID=A0A5E4VW51_9BURK|nr:DMT family transporter [Pandoraea iniqua]VVE15819.1 hypothetical protein PIN31115_02867 [Pandoraea iniqua]